MQNRRHDPRYRFPAPERLLVPLRQAEGNREVHAQLIDLGLGGMCVAWESATSPFLLDERVITHLDLPRLSAPLTLTGSVIYLERRGAELVCGVQFLPLLIPAANDERERALSRFLAEQRRRRAKPRGRGVRLKLFTGSE